MLHRFCHSISLCPSCPLHFPILSLLTRSAKWAMFSVSLPNNSADPLSAARTFHQLPIISISCVLAFLVLKHFVKVCVDVFVAVNITTNIFCGRWEPVAHDWVLYGFGCGLMFGFGKGSGRRCIKLLRYARESLYRGLRYVRKNLFRAGKNKAEKYINGGQWAFKIDKI